MPRNGGYLPLWPIDVHDVRAAFAKELTASDARDDERDRRASRRKLEALPNDRSVRESLLAESAIGLQNERDRLMQVRARLLERGALRVRARKLLDKSDEALEYLLKDGGQFERHGEILDLLSLPAPNDIKLSGERSESAGARC